VLLVLLDLLVVDFRQSTCNVTWSRNGYGAFFTQVLVNADIGGYDGAVTIKYHSPVHQLTTIFSGDMSAILWILPYAARSQVESYNLVRQAQTQSATSS
jgi:hypothetical protein